jgi:hypothetical protein
MSHPLGQPRVDCPTQDTTYKTHPSRIDVPSLPQLDGVSIRPISLLSVAPCPPHIHGGGVLQCRSTATVSWGDHASMGVVHHHPKCISTTILSCPHPPQQAPVMSHPMSMSRPPQSVTQGNPRSTSSSFLVIPDEGSVATMLYTGHPTSAMNLMVLNMTAPLVAQALAPAPLAPATMLPPLNDAQCFPKWLLKVQSILHVKSWNGITTHNTGSLACELLLYDLYILLISFLDGDMLKPYIQGGPTSFANQGILMSHDLISMLSSSSAGLIWVFTWFLQDRMLPTETIIQYCSKIRGPYTELGRLGQPILEPLSRLSVVHGLNPKFADFASQVATIVIDVVHGLNSWDAFVHRLCDYATHLKIRSALTTTSADIDPSDLVWLSQPGLDKNQANCLMNLFTFPIHLSNDHTLDHCVVAKRFIAVPPNTNSASGGSTRRGGGSGTSDSDGGSGRGYQRRSYNYSNTDTAPSHPPPSSSRQSTQLGTAAQASVPYVKPPPTSTTLVSVPAVPAPAPVGAVFSASLSHNQFAALASPNQIVNPATRITTEQAATVDSDFTFEFATGQGIPLTLSNHSKYAPKMYIGTACQSDMTSTYRLPPIQEKCVSNAKSTQPVQVDTSHIEIADSGATYIFFARRHFLTYTPVHGNIIMTANGASIPVLGMGTVSLTINGIPVKIIHCYHAPGLRASIYLIHRHRQTHGCSFLGDQSGMYLTFGRIFTRVQDEIDCCIQLRPLPYHSSTRYALDHMTPPLQALSPIQSFQPPLNQPTPPIPAASHQRPVTYRVPTPNTASSSSHFQPLATPKLTRMTFQSLDLPP